MDGDFQKATRPRMNLREPSKMTLEPLRAPKRYCAARPPEPWQAGMAPNQQPTRLIAATETPSSVTVGAMG